MSKAPPSFQFYPGDWLVGTAHLSHSSKATYLLLLCFEWTTINVLFDPPKLARMLGISDAEFISDWSELEDKFTIDEANCLRNTRLETIREEALTLSEARREAGRKGGCSKAKAKLKQRGKQKRSKGSLKSEDRSLKSKDRKQMTGSNVAMVVKHYQKHHPRSRAGDKECSNISARLGDGFSVEDLTLAIDGCHVSPYHCGTNDRGSKYQTLELIFRDASHVTQFIEHAQTQGDPQLSERSRQSLNAISQWLEGKS